MKRISVSLPDSLYEKMQKFKEEVNYSKVARGAIEAEIRKFEFWNDSVKDIANIIERFRKEKKELMNNWEKKGFEWGQDFVKNSQFYEVESYIETLPKLLEIDQPWPNDDVALDYEEHFREDPEWTITAAKGFWKGFAKGAISLWREIKDQI
jgi:predicted CopG family antitoxin